MYLICFPWRRGSAQLIAASAKDAGINIEVIREPKDGSGQTSGIKKAGARVIGRPTNTRLDVQSCLYQRH